MSTPIVTKNTDIRLEAGLPEEWMPTNGITFTPPRDGTIRDTLIIRFTGLDHQPVVRLTYDDGHTEEVQAMKYPEDLGA